ncbi:melatonin receptor type 1B-A-like isoform X1 [Styela clava]
MQFYKDMVNYTNNTSRNELESYNATISTVDYWPEFGVLQYFEFSYILLIIILGLFGNIIVISSIVLEKKIHTSGNIFIINLAVADLLVCSITLPSVAVNIIIKSNALSPFLCDIVGYIVTATCACSVCNLCLIAVNRYWAVVRSASYRRLFTRKIGLTMAISAWIWSILLVSPTVLGWGGLTFDAKALVCGWSDTASLSYSIFLIFVGVLLPLGIIAFSYYKIFSTVRASGRWTRNLASNGNSLNSGDRKRRSMQRERSLIYTLVSTVIVFCVCWSPYAIHVLIDPEHISPHAKKVLVWLALSNSSANFIIYGTLNPAFKKRYRKLFQFIFRCIKRGTSSRRQSASGCSSPGTGDRSRIKNAGNSPIALRELNRPSESREYNLIRALNNSTVDSQTRDELKVFKGVRLA